MFYRVDFKNYSSNYGTFEQACDMVYYHPDSYGEVTSLHRVYLNVSAPMSRARIVSEKPLYSPSTGWDLGRLTPAQQKQVRKNEAYRRERESREE